MSRAIDAGAIHTAKIVETPVEAPEIIETNPGQFSTTVGIETAERREETIPFPDVHAEEVLASIDPAAETSVTAGIVDHETQIGSWKSEDQAAAEHSLRRWCRPWKARPSRPLPERCEESIPFPDQPTLARLIAGVEDEKAKVRVVKIADGFHQRAAFETDKDPERQKDQAVRKVRFNGCSRRPSEAPSARAAFQPPGS